VWSASLPLSLLFLLLTVDRLNFWRHRSMVYYLKKPYADFFAIRKFQEQPLDRPVRLAVAPDHCQHIIKRYRRHPYFPFRPSGAGRAVEALPVLPGVHRRLSLDGLALRRAARQTVD
jgi:hypothetical protein